MNTALENQIIGDGETFGVASCVDRVIAAFHTGASILQRTRELRPARGAHPLPRLLEESIAQAPEEIEREKRRGIQRFGERFEAGDYPAIFAIQQITIELQCSLLAKIGNVDDEVTDFSALARAADQGRDDTITTLIRLRQRLLQAETTANLSTLALSTSVAPLQVNRREGRDATLSPMSATNSVISMSTQGSEQSYQLDPRSSTASENQIYRRASAALSVRSDQHTISSSTTIPSVSSGLADVKVSSYLNMPKPSRKNNYLGFCKTAWKLQNGDDKALVKSKDWTQSAQSTAYSLACSRFRCEFRSDLKSSGNPSVIWNKVFVHKDLGIKYRWSFLAKSHVTQRTVVNKDYSYQCLFCVFQGLQVPVMNLTALLDHIRHEHRDGALGEVILDRTGCIDRRVCKDGEKFDINLFPIDNSYVAELCSPIPQDERRESMQVSEPTKNFGVSDRVFELYA